MWLPVLTWVNLEKYHHHHHYSACTISVRSQVLIPGEWMVNNEAEISGGGDGTAVLVLVVCQWYVDDDVGFMV